MKAEEQAAKDAEETRKNEEAELLKEEKRQEEQKARKDEEEQKLDALRAKQEAENLKKDEAAIAEVKRKEQQRKLDSISEARKLAAVAAELEIKKQKELDSINAAKKEELLAKEIKIKEQQRLDSIARLSEAKELAAKKAAEQAAIIEKANETDQIDSEVVKPQAGEKYEEVANEDGLEPGYYLIANVFGTKKYFDAFMSDVRSKGLQPKSFYRNLNKYNYAYLERYNTIAEARRARDSNFDGKYAGKTWIFRVVGK